MGVISTTDGDLSHSLGVIPSFLEADVASEISQLAVVILSHHGGIFEDHELVLVLAVEPVIEEVHLDIGHAFVIRVLELERLFVDLSHSLDFGLVFLEFLAVDVTYTLVDPFVEVHIVFLVELDGAHIHDHLVTETAVFLREDIHVVGTCLVGVVFLFQEETDAHLDDVVAVGSFAHLVVPFFREIKEKVIGLADTGQFSVEGDELGRGQQRLQFS